MRLDEAVMRSNGAHESCHFWRMSGSTLTTCTVDSMQAISAPVRGATPSPTTRTSVSGCELGVNDDDDDDDDDERVLCVSKSLLEKSWSMTSTMAILSQISLHTAFRGHSSCERSNGDE
jgi:hypothetical protein